jgi:nucleoside-diphosphate-sugar epimerase
MKALVFGGTGPTGPYVVDGLLERGYEVAIIHSGTHEAEFAGRVEDIHGDVHFPETLSDALGNRNFDLVVCQYGRLRVVAEFMQGKTPQFIGMGGTVRGQARDAKWGPLGRPFMTDEDAGPPDMSERGLGPKIYTAMENLLSLHDKDNFSVTYIGHHETYGPRQQAPADWSVIKRILDGRRQLVIANGGIKIRQRVFAENCAQSVLLCVDKPDESGGEHFVLSERPLYTERQRVELICATLGCEVELIDMPFPLAKHFWSTGPAHGVNDDRKIREVLGYRELISAADAQVTTVNWLVENQHLFSHEWEDQLTDTFDYAGEDQLVRVWKESYASLEAVTIASKIHAHNFRHPERPNESWRRPDASSEFAKFQAERTDEYY